MPAAINPASTQIDLEDVVTHEIYHFATMTECCEFLHRNYHYINYRIRQGFDVLSTSKKRLGYSRFYKWSLPNGSKNYTGEYVKVKGSNAAAKATRKIQLCVYCANCSNKCAFIASGGKLPVPGWEAKQENIKVYLRTEDTWIINRCPNFYPDDAIIRCKAEMSTADWSSLGEYRDMVVDLRKGYVQKIMENSEDLKSVKLEVGYG